MTTIQQRTWELPEPRVTWDEAHQLVRSDNQARSATTIRDEEIDDAMQRAVDAAWPRCFEQHLWQVELTEAVDSITLPWAPDDVVLCAMHRAGTSVNALTVPCFETALFQTFWSVEGNQWRWLGGSGRWPAGTVSLALRVLRRPRRKGTGTDEEATYCTLSPKYLLPLAKIELVAQMTTDQGGTILDGINTQELLRRQVELRLPRMQRPASGEHLAPHSLSTVVWWSWSQENITFDQLG